MGDFDPRGRLERMADSIDQRAALLERKVAVMEQRLGDVTDDLRAVAPLVGSHAELRTDLSYMKRDLARACERIDECRTAIEEDQEDRARVEQERRRERRTLIVSLLGIFVSLLAILASLTAGGLPG